MTDVEKLKCEFAKYEPGTIARVANAVMEGLADMTCKLMTLTQHLRDNSCASGTWIKSGRQFFHEDESGVKAEAGYAFWALLPDEFVVEAECPNCGMAVSIIPEHIESMRIHQTPEADYITGLQVKFECHVCSTEITGELCDGHIELTIKDKN
jgi:hypothetical protein